MLSVLIFVYYLDNTEMVSTFTETNITNDMKRYCQVLNLPKDEELIKGYIEEHAHVWPEIQAGIREVGILDMQIFLFENQAFMIMDTTDDFDFVKDNARLAKLPHQAEWEAHVAKFQGCDPNAESTAKWQLMTKIFELEK